MTAGVGQTEYQPSTAAINCRQPVMKARASVHKVEAAVCCYCQDVFASKHGLNRHKSAMHRKEMQSSGDCQTQKKAYSVKPVASAVKEEDSSSSRGAVQLVVTAGLYPRSPDAWPREQLLPEQLVSSEKSSQPPYAWPREQLLPEQLVSSEKSSQPPLKQGGAKSKSASSAKKKPRKRKAKRVPKWKCEFPGCSKAFFREQHLERHMPSHTGQKRFPCDAAGCVKVFAFKDTMQRHRRNHNAAIWNFQCGHCSKVSKRRDHLISHIMSHLSSSKREEAKEMIQFEDKKAFYMGDPSDISRGGRK